MSTLTSENMNPHTGRDSIQDRIFNYVNLFIVILMLVIMIYPLYLVLICSISDPNMVTLGEVTLYPKGITLAGYEAIFTRSIIWRAYLNSVIYTVSGTLISIVVTMGAAYTLSRKFPGQNLLAFMFVFTMLFNGGLIPTFLIVRQIGLYNSPWICILMGGVSVWNLMVARTYIATTIPEELYEAAVLDGASHFLFFFKIILPLCGTIIAVLSVYYGVVKWNDYWTGLIFISTREYLPLQTVLKDILASLKASLEINNMVSGNSITTAMVDNAAEIVAKANLAKYCVIVIATVPAIVLYVFMQKFFVKGVMIGSIKG